MMLNRTCTLQTGVYDFYSSDHLTIALNSGYQINPFIYLGIGLSADINELSNVKPIISLPIYVNPRFYLNNRKYSLYFDIKLGYAMNVKRSNGYIGDYYYHNLYYYNSVYIQSSDYNDYITITQNVEVKGVVCAFEFGVNYKHSNLGVVLGVQNFKKERIVENHYYYFYDTNPHSMDTAPEYYNNDIVDYSNNKICVSFMLKYGYTIFLNKK